MVGRWVATPLSQLLRERHLWGAQLFVGVVGASQQCGDARGCARRHQAGGGLRAADGLQLGVGDLGGERGPLSAKRVRAGGAATVAAGHIAQPLEVSRDGDAVGQHGRLRRRAAAASYTAGRPGHLAPPGPRALLQKVVPSSERPCCVRYCHAPCAPDMTIHCVPKGGGGAEGRLSARGRESRP